MITNNSTKYEYKAVLLPSYKENIADTARLKELADELTKVGAEYWEPLDLSKHLPSGYVMLRRVLTVAPKRSIFSSVPKAAVTAIAPPAAKPLVAAALSPTAGSTDKATA